MQSIHSAEHTRTDSIRGSLSQGYSKTENEGGGGLYSTIFIRHFAFNVMSNFLADTRSQKSMKVAGFFGVRTDQSWPSQMFSYVNDSTCP